MPQSFTRLLDHLPALPRELPVLIAGPTASGKSALALAIAEAQGRKVVNADALQCYDHWPIVSAQPTAEDRTLAPHLLYCHIGRDVAYSVGDWLRDVAPLLADAPVIVGGTGLYLSALTDGLAEIPKIPPEIRAASEARLAEIGLAAIGQELDVETRARIDLANPARVLRAHEVLSGTGRGLALWQKTATQPLLPLSSCVALNLLAPPEWLNPRITLRFNQMLDRGALLEAKANLPDFDFARPGTVPSARKS